MRDCNWSECEFTQRTVSDEKVSVGPWLLALFIFVVCGSGEWTYQFKRLTSDVSCRRPNNKHVNLNTICFYTSWCCESKICRQSWPPLNVFFFWHTHTVKPCEGRDNNAHYLHGQGWTDSMTFICSFSWGTARGFAGVATLKTALKNIANNTA